MMKPATANFQIGSIPRYVQIAETITNQIEEGLLSPGSRLPPEREYSDQLGVNRVTLRQALQVLETRGLITRRQGAGTYVTPPKIDRSAGQFFPFSASMRNLGYVPTGKVILLEQRPAEEAIAQQLKVTAGTPIYYCHRLRLVNGETVMLEQFALLAEKFPGFEQFDLETRSSYEIMETEFSIIIATARQSLEAVTASPYEAGLLGVAPGVPLMLERRVASDQYGQAVEYSKDLYRGDRFRFVTPETPNQIPSSATGLPLAPQIRQNAN